MRGQQVCLLEHPYRFFRSTPRISHVLRTLAGPWIIRIIPMVQAPPRSYSLKRRSQSVIQEVSERVYWIWTNKPDAVQGACAAAEEYLELAVRQQVYQGKWAAVGVTDVRELYDLQAVVWMQDSTCCIMINMGHVMDLLRKQDDINVN